MAAGDVTILGVSEGSIPASDKRMIWGTVQLDGSNPTPINLSAYLSLVEAYSIEHNSAVAPGDDPTYFTGAISGATLNVYAWKNTGGTDPTLVASTDNATTLSFMIVGKRA